MASTTASLMNDEDSTETDFVDSRKSKKKKSTKKDKKESKKKSKKEGLVDGENAASVSAGRKMAHSAHGEAAATNAKGTFAKKYTAR